MTNEREREALVALLEEVSARLAEHADSVRIICTVVREGGDSQMVSRGRGNWYAQFGSVKEWLIREKEIIRMDEREEREGGEAV